MISRLADPVQPAWPLVSLVTPTEGRLSEICSLIRSVRVSLTAHTTKLGITSSVAIPIEMIIVDSTPTPLEPSMIDGWDPAFMRLLRGSINVRQKRNQGARMARGTWLAFIDSDCFVAPDYVEKLLQAIANQPYCAFAGRIEFQGDENRVWAVIAETQLTRVETQTHGEGEVAWCATANLIVTRQAFDELGGFDETLPFRLGGDDVDFGLRLSRAGTPLRILPSVVVVHPKIHWSHLKAILPRAWRWGRIEYHLAQRHPERVRLMPPYVAATLLSIVLVTLIGIIATGRFLLLTMIPLWFLISTLLQTWLLGSGSGRPFWPRYDSNLLPPRNYQGIYWSWLAKFPLEGSYPRGEDGRFIPSGVGGKLGCSTRHITHRDDRAGNHSNMKDVLLINLSKALAHAFRQGCVEGCLIIEHPESSYPDMPLSTIISVTLIAIAFVTSPWSSATVPMVISTLVGLPLLMSAMGALCSPTGRTSGALAQWTYLALEFGRLWTCIRLGYPGTILRRYRRHDRQVSEEWNRITATAWSVWIIVVTEITLLWVGAH